ncbi:hypothetical protein ACU635_36345 [[Actinomadura] parvosata]|uniref:hypothetical protein n=1 Tax=[Actinomadura] parvosata TaxID=1955412 RepID=UPI00406C0CE1
MSVEPGWRRSWCARPSAWPTSATRAARSPGDVRRLGALEGGWPALAGSLAGGVVYALTHLSGPLAPVPFVVVLMTAGGLVAGLTVKGGFPIGGKYGTAVMMAAGMVLLLFGLTMAATRLIRACAARTGRRARSPETLPAARLVESDPRAWTRALSVVGLTVFFGAGAGAQQAGTGYGYAHALVDVALLVAMLTSAAALVVHQAEELIDLRRSFAALAAAGVPERSLGRVLVRQAAIAALPVCAVAAAAGVGVVVLAVLDIYQARGLVWALTRAVAMTGIGVLTAMPVALAARPLLRGALHLETLRADR